MENTQQIMLEFLQKHELGVISTIHTDRNAPESAVVGFANNDKLELVFGTSNTTRKYTNIQNNPHISFVIGWNGAIGTLQYEGVARELASEEAGPYIQLLTTKTEASKRFITFPDQRYFVVKPTWIRLQDNINSRLHELSF